MCVCTLPHAELGLAQAYFRRHPTSGQATLNTRFFITIVFCLLCILTIARSTMSSRVIVDDNNSNLLHLLAMHKDAMSGIDNNKALRKQDLDKVIPVSIKELLSVVLGLEDDFNRKLEKVRKDSEAKDACMDSLQAQIVKLSLAQEKSQQYQNRDTFKICGIKKSPDLGPKGHEDTDTVVVKFLEKAKVPLPVTELSMTHRVPSREAGRPEALLVKLRSRIVRNQVMRKKKEMREDVELKAEYPDAFIVEHLTPLRAKVAYKLRQDVNVEKCWSIDGRLKVIMKGSADTDKPIPVDNLSQLTRIPGWKEEDVTKLVLEA